MGDPEGVQAGLGCSTPISPKEQIPLCPDGRKKRGRRNDKEESQEISRLSLGRRQRGHSDLGTQLWSRLCPDLRPGAGWPSMWRLVGPEL